MLRHRHLLLALPLIFLVADCSHLSLTGPDAPPSTPREFRAAWVASVGNIDWPSKPNLSSAQQQDEILAIVNTASRLHLNCLIVQIRTSCDALYPSKLEPWSEYLTGQQGKAPNPFYDPLQLWIETCHAHGIEFHAWFNPFRARQDIAKGPESPYHFSRTNPKIVKRYGKYLWLDPGEPEAQEYSLKVFQDVIHRYDIDGIHIDDYFYPYPLKGQDFPDDASYARYQKSGGQLSRADWRRQNINTFVQRLYTIAHKEKPYLKLGISPFGIWQPGHPPVVKGFNAYESIYADSKLWLNNGWCDYFTPQLYWKPSAPAQPFAPLLDWWIGENTHARHIWPGLYTSRVNMPPSPWPTSDILQEIAITRSRPGAPGVVHFSFKCLLLNWCNISEELLAGPYAQEALIPYTPWLDDKTPLPRPRLHTTHTDNQIKLHWEAGDNHPVWLWSLRIRRGQNWSFQVLPAQTRDLTIPAGANAILICAVNRIGRESDADYTLHP